MSTFDKLKLQLDACPLAIRRQAFNYLRKEFSIHPLEVALNTKAEIVLEALHKSNDLTLRMFKGILAEAAFGVEVVDRLKGWKNLPTSGTPAYDFILKDKVGELRVQVKLQRSKDGRPWLANEIKKHFHSLPKDVFVVETQKTRAGKKKGTGQKTRPYRFGEFDILAVALYPSTQRWDTFMYTVADWLIPDETEHTQILKYQPVASKPSEDWTNDFLKVVTWFRSGTKKTICGT